MAPFESVHRLVEPLDRVGDVAGPPGATAHEDVAVDTGHHLEPGADLVGAVASLLAFAALLERLLARVSRAVPRDPFVQLRDRDRPALEQRPRRRLDEDRGSSTRRITVAS